MGWDVGCFAGLNGDDFNEAIVMSIGPHCLERVALSNWNRPGGRDFDLLYQIPAKIGRRVPANLGWIALEIMH